MARAYVLVVALAVGGCSGSEIVQNWAPPASAPELTQPNHRRIVADNIKVIFPDQTALGDIEISGVRPVDHLRARANAVKCSSDSLRRSLASCAPGFGIRAYATDLKGRIRALHLRGKASSAAQCGR